MLALGMDFARRLALANEHLTFDDLQPILMENKNWLHTDAFSIGSIHICTTLRAWYHVGGRN